MTDQFSQNAKNVAWERYVNKRTSKAELSRVFFGKDPQTAFNKVKSGLEKELAIKVSKVSKVSKDSATAKPTTQKSPSSAKKLLKK